MTYPTFTNGQVLPASDLNAIGLWLVKSQTVGTGVSSVTVTDAFSANFDDYLITWSGGSQSVDTNLSLFLGTSVPANGYYLSMIYANTSGGANVAGNSNTAAWSWAGGGFTSAYAHITLKGPFLAKETQMLANSRYSTVFGHSIAYLANTTSYSAFVVGPASGTMTGGTISVYGYRK